MSQLVYSDPDVAWSNTNKKVIETMKAKTNKKQKIKNKKLGNY